MRMKTTQARKSEDLTISTRLLPKRINIIKRHDAFTSDRRLKRQGTRNAQRRLALSE